MMTVLSLWLPILLAAVAVFLASSVIHMMLGLHKNDVGAIPDERQVADALRPFAIPPGDYAMPHGHAKEMHTPEFIQKMTEGPVAIITVRPNEPANMGKSLALWFGYSLAVGAVAAYVAGSTLSIGAEYGEVFRVVAAVAFKESRAGLLLRTSRDDEVAAGAMGVHIPRLRWQAFIMEPRCKKK